MKIKFNYFFKRNYTFLSIIFGLGVLTNSNAQSFYDISTIQTIEITFEASNWDELMDTYYADDNGEKLMGSVVINGIEFDSVGVKYKGNSTYQANNGKNPLSIYLDEYINQNYNSYELIKLSNGKNDPSFVREVLSYEIARKYMDAPKSNYAKVFINGSYYGMFSSSEAINKDFIERRLNSNRNNIRIKCNPENTFSGNGSSLEYLGADSSLYYSFYEVKSDYGWQELIDLTYDIVNDAGNIETVLDIDRVIWMLAYNNVLVNLDSYTGPFRQNYYLVKDDNGRILPVVWDMNESIGAFEMITTGGPPSPTSVDELIELDPFLREGDSTYPLLNLVYNNDRYRKMYIAHCKTIMEENFNNSWYSSKADTLQTLIYDDVDNDPNAFYTISQFTSNISTSINEGGFPPQSTVGITELMEDRVTYLQNHDAYGYTQPVISNIVSPEEIVPYTMVSITAEISNADYAYLGYRHSKDEVFTKVQMFDDGSHDDGASGDGVFGVSFPVDESNSHYYIYAENSESGIFSPARAEHEYYKISAVPNFVENNDVVINELLASNLETQADQEGEFDDWIELYNNTNTDIALNGYYLTDDNADIMKWAFPDTVIEAEGYLIVWADKDDLQTGLHANFKLSSAGESVYLVNSAFEVVNYVDFSIQTTDVAYARFPNGTGDFGTQSPTFASNNDEADFVNELGNLTNMRVYPNPMQNQFTIEFENNDIQYYKIINLAGQILSSGKIIQNRIIDTSNWNNGVYILEVNQRFTKLIKN